MVSTNAPVFKIHPAIGIARIGDADPDQYFIGPETPGVPANWDFKTQQFLSFKHSGHIKRQAARFHRNSVLDTHQRSRGGRKERARRRKNC